MELAVAELRRGGSGPEQGERLPPLREDLELLPASRQPDGSPAWNLYDSLRHQFFRIGWLEFEILSRWHLADAEAIADEISSTTTLAVRAADVLAIRQFLFVNQLLQQAVVGRRACSTRFTSRAVVRFSLSSFSAF